ncbi:MAG TPA: hypothetical protein VI670_17375 [Thermoanaerobaculia bacterium]
MRHSFTDTLREASEFFAKRGRIYDTLDNVTRRPDDEGIEYAVIGALALVAHGYERRTPQAIGLYVSSFCIRILRSEFP